MLKRSIVGVIPNLIQYLLKRLVIKIFTSSLIYLYVIVALLV